MKKPSAWQRFRYWFDNVMSKGTLSLLLLLAVITAVVVIVGGLLAVAIGGADGSGDASASETLWYTLMHAINTGVISKEEGTIPYLVIMTIVTLVGIFVTSFLIGTISNGIQEKVSDLQRGKSRVIEKGHTVIIGFDENVTSIIEELALANRNQKNAAIVIMANADKTEMEDTIRDRVSNLGKIRIVCRSGHPDSPRDLKICSLDTCKAIIVNLSDDFLTVKTVLACESLLDEYGNDDAFITATVHDREVLQPARIAGGDRAEILNFQKTIARLMVQAGRHPGMSEILAELLSFKGNEIYVVDVPDAMGLSLQDVNLRLPHCTAIGMVRNDEPLINPDASAIVQRGDQLIVIAHDDEVATLQNRATVNEQVFQREPNVVEDPQTLLVLGYSDMLSAILLEEDAHAAPGSKVIIAAEKGKIEDDMLPEPEEFRNIELEVRPCRIYKRRALERLASEGPSSILLMADSDLPAEEADARTLMLQLLLNDIADEIGTEIPLTIEMNSTRNQKLSQTMRATDFVIGSRITAKMMVQIAEERHKNAILNSLLSDGGSTVYMKPITRYVLTGEPVDFYTLGASAARYGEIAIGYKKFADDGSFSIELNPRSKAATKFEDCDDIIVIARN